MRLGFYLNPVARLRESLGSTDPDPAVIAAIASNAGADVILIGWNPAGGQITERDVRVAREIVRSDLLLVVPMQAGVVDSVAGSGCQVVILLDSNWDDVKPAASVMVEVEIEALAAINRSFHATGIPASVLIEPSLNAIKAAARVGLTGVVLDCSHYTEAETDEEAETALGSLNDASIAAGKFGLTVAFGHGLTYHNVHPVAGLPYGDDIYIGRAILNRALYVGIDRAIAEMSHKLPLQSNR